MAPKCQCGAEKRTYGTSVYLCPGCDFSQCTACKTVVQELYWNACPKCGARQAS